MNGYVLDHLAVVAGLSGTEDSHERREVARLISDALRGGGPSIAVPAICLATATATRPELADHFLMLVCDAPPGALVVPGLIRTTWLDDVRRGHPQLDAAACHAGAYAMGSSNPIITTDVGLYARLPVEAAQL